VPFGDAADALDYPILERWLEPIQVAMMFCDPPCLLPAWCAPDDFVDRT
jgi:hypothetical protein